LTATTSLKEESSTLSSFQTHRSSFGVNKFKEVPLKPFLDFFLEAFEDRTLQILLVSAIVSIILGVTVEDPSYVYCNYFFLMNSRTGWIEGTAIFVAALVVSLVTAGTLGIVPS
jgi:magnesium-transporting ATPase (P-type)